MNKRKVFEKVKAHLLKQNAQAIRSSKCLYQAGELRCAIGCLIPDGHDGLGFVGAVDELLDVCPDLKELWGIENDLDIMFLNDLQYIHDNYLPSLWSERLEAFEEEHLEQA